MFENISPLSLWQSEKEILDGTLQTNEGSFMYDVAAPLNLEIFRAYLSMNALENIFYIDKNSGPYIDKMCAVFGLTRKSGTKAGCTIDFYGAVGAVVPAGAVFLTSDGLEFILDDKVALTDGTGSGTLTAASDGAEYNINAGDIIRSQRSYTGVNIKGNTAASGGTDAESDAALVNRFYNRLQKPGTSGNGYYYQNTAMEVPGVGGARVLGLLDGPGRVLLLFVDENGLPVSDEINSAALAYLDGYRCVGAHLDSGPPSSFDIGIEAAVKLKTGAYIDDVREEYAAAVGSYLAELVFSDFCIVINCEQEDYKSAVLCVSYAKLLSLLMECSGVADVENFYLNGGTVNIYTADYLTVPVLGKVDLHV